VYGRGPDVVVVTRTVFIFNRQGILMWSRLSNSVAVKSHSEPQFSWSWGARRSYGTEYDTGFVASTDPYIELPNPVICNHPLLVRQPDRICPRCRGSHDYRLRSTTAPSTPKILLQETAEHSSSPTHPFHRHVYHPGVSMGPLSPLDFYLASPELESPGRYRPGGYHPVHLGDLYCQRYRVIRKLGLCGYSTVWLTRDLQSTAQT